MSRFLIPARLFGLLAAVLVVPFLLVAAPANADDPVRPTKISLGAYNLLDDETQILLAGSVSPIPPPPNNFNVTGTATFRDADGNVLAADVPVALDNGYTKAYVPKPTTTTTYSVEFHGTGGFADSTNTTTYTPSRLRTAYVTPEPSLMKIGTGLVPTVTLTLSAYAKYADGTPAPGVTVDFSTECLAQAGKGCSLIIPWCSATTNAQGFATCKGAGLLGSVVSILNGSVIMTAYSRNGDHVQVTNYVPPVIVRS